MPSPLSVSTVLEPTESYRFDNHSFPVLLGAFSFGKSVSFSLGFYLHPNGFKTQRTLPLFQSLSGDGCHFTGLETRWNCKICWSDNPAGIPRIPLDNARIRTHSTVS